MEKIRIVPDAAPVPGENAYIYEIDASTPFRDEIVYTPHFGENFGNAGFLKLKLYCARRRTRVIAFGHLNQLPEFSVLADRAILQGGDHLLSKLYLDKVTGWTTEMAIMRRLSKARFVQGHQMSGDSHNFLLSRGQCDARLGADVTPELRQKHELIVAAMDEIEDQELIDAFAWPEVCIRQSTWDLFHRLDLPENIICSEIKEGWGFGSQIREWLARSDLPSVVGVDHVFQHELVAKVGSHFMGIQFLASWLKNWTFVCIGGSANLFALLPVKAIVLFDNWYKNTSTERCLRGLAQALRRARRSNPIVSTARGQRTDRQISREGDAHASRCVEIASGHPLRVRAVI